MIGPRKKKLIELGSEALAEALLNLAIHSNEANDLIEQLIATPHENIQRFKKKIADLKLSTRYIDWRDAEELAFELEMLLQDLQSGVDDPCTGVNLVTIFYETDATIFEMCDDSSGSIGAIFYFDAKELFVDYATRCADKEKIADIILKVNKTDNYCIRNALIDCAGECLPEKVIRTMITTLQHWVDKEKDKYGKQHYLMLIGSLARQIKDAKLFEQTCTASWETLPTQVMIDIAQVYFESEEIETAYSWLQKIPQDESSHTYEQDKLLKEIYHKQGNSEKLTELLYQNFSAYHATDTLEALLDVVGHNKREDIINNETQKILKTDPLCKADAEFLVAVGKIDEAEKYLLERADKLDGNAYSSLPSLAEAMASENRYLISSLIYRSLLVSILARGYTKAYPHGIEYLKKLDKLATTISDWKNFNHHEAFKQQIMQNHGRKRSFWSKYKVKE